MKKYILVAFIVCLAVAASGCTTHSLTEPDAISMVKVAHPELKDYPSNNLPPKSIRTEKTGDGWYIAFVQEGSGRPIISATCFFVDEKKNQVVNNGEFTPNPGSDSMNFSIKTCTAGNTGNPVHECQVETCHGFAITCGPNPEICTEMYMLGDKCLQYASCGFVNGTCQQIQNPEFNTCKSCVEDCVSRYKNDTMKEFECENTCK